jgi:hypothetical protein
LGTALPVTEYESKATRSAVVSFIVKSKYFLWSKVGKLLLRILKTESA